MPRLWNRRGAPPSGPSTVIVGNTSANPVPVTGTVNLGGTPTVSLGSSTVQTKVISNEANPVFVRGLDWAPLDPAQANATVTLSCPSACGPTTQKETLYVVPRDKRLVIEFMTASTESLNSGGYQMFVETTAGGGSATHRLVFEELNGFKRAAQAMRVYADPGSVVSVGVVATSSANVVFSFSGYLVDSP